MTEDEWISTHDSTYVKNEIWELITNFTIWFFLWCFVISKIASPSTLLSFFEWGINTILTIVVVAIIPHYPYSFLYMISTYV